MTGTADTEAPSSPRSTSWKSWSSPPTARTCARIFEDSSTRPSARSSPPSATTWRSCSKKGQPVLVGTVSIAKSEVLSKLLKQRGVQHDVLNAKQHEREAEIVAQAGRKGRITISTNMAGRGTDILLGGNPEFLARREVGPEPQPNRRPPGAGAGGEGHGDGSPVTRRKWSRLRAEHAAGRSHDAAVEKYKGECTKRARRGGGAGRPAHPRHRAARVAPHRQPASRPVGAPGRSRLVQVLPLARRRSDAHLRERPHRQADGDASACRRASPSSTPG